MVPFYLKCLLVILLSSLMSQVSHVASENAEDAEDDDSEVKADLSSEAVWEALGEK